ncbi:N-acetyltransferase [Paenibacillus senegalensis]|uniref:N-acetyltransferase n=1 Tax=Paenibacillus senegalensis TaxID=1465766 RepID=UPI0002887849|nr:N-acetyltransferase [Paenibacillus senegalensis]
MIRQLHSADLHRVMEIWLETNIQAHSFIPQAYWQENASLVRELLPQADVWVYEQADGDIGGFIGIMEASFVAGLFVDSNIQSGGVGSALLSYCKQKYPELSLHVYEDNIRAVRFYEKNGFTIVGEMVNDATGKQEYVMQWKSGSR